MAAHWGNCETQPWMCGSGCAGGTGAWFLGHPMTKKMGQKDQQVLYITVEGSGHCSCSPVPQREICLCHCILFYASVNFLWHWAERRVPRRTNWTEILEKLIPHLKKKKKSFEGKLLDSPENFPYFPTVQPNNTGERYRFAWFSEGCSEFMKKLCVSGKIAPQDWIKT